MQRLPTGRRGGAVHRIADGACSLGHRRRIGSVPCGVVGGEPGQLGEVIGEHRVGDTGPERVDADVPVDHQPGRQRRRLRIDEHLRALGNRPHRGAELVGHLAGEQVAEPERAGVDDRSQRLVAAVAAKVAQHRQARSSSSDERCCATFPAPRGSAPQACPVCVRSMSSISDEVKQPTSFSTSGWNGSRPNIGRLSRNREPLDHRASALEYDAATAIAGVSPRRCAAAKSASRVATSKMCQSRTLRRGSACSASGTSGSAGDSGSSGTRSAHHCRSSSVGPGVGGGQRGAVLGGRCSPARAVPRRGRTPRGRP